jgi:hypothetical protein
LTKELGADVTIKLKEDLKEDPTSATEDADATTDEPLTADGIEATEDTDAAEATTWTEDGGEGCCDAEEPCDAIGAAEE